MDLDRRDLKGLTLTEPYASLVALRAKRIETRSWLTTYRGPLLIHAAATYDAIGGAAAFRRMIADEPFRSALAPLGGLADGRTQGKGVAVCQLVAVVPTTFLRDDGAWSYVSAHGRQERFVLTDEERAFGDYRAGRYAWLLADITPLRTPVSVRGLQRLWNVTPALKAEIRRALATGDDDAHP